MVDYDVAKLIPTGATISEIIRYLKKIRYSLDQYISAEQ